MKFMIASDIHGSALYCRELISAFEREAPCRLALLGDLLYHGPRNDLPDGYDPKGVINMLNPLSDKLLCVRGNCDAEVDSMVLKFPMMADYAVLCLSDRLCFLTHGHQSAPPLGRGDILIQGHTHIPSWTPFGDGNLCLNPGSVSIPKENSPRGYMLLDEHTAVWKTLGGEEYHTLAL